MLDDRETAHIKHVESQVQAIRANRTLLHFEYELELTVIFHNEYALVCRACNSFIYRILVDEKQRNWCYFWLSRRTLTRYRRISNLKQKNCLPQERSAEQFRSHLASHSNNHITSRSQCPFHLQDVKCCNKISFASHR